MKFFDYKFLILLGLTLVVYFIYREVEYLREKVDKIERTFKSNSKSIEQTDNANLESNVNSTLVLEENKFPILALPKMGFNTNSTFNLPIPNKNSSPKISPKIISVDLMSTPVTSLHTTLASVPALARTKCNKLPENQIELKNQLSEQKKNNDIIESEPESESDETTTSISEVSKHLAIYSNDNDQFDETQTTLMDSVNANKNALKFDYSKMEYIINNLSSDEIIKEKEKQLSEMSSEKSIAKISPISKLSLESDENKKEASNQETLKKDSTFNKLDEQILSTMKLPEIKKISEQYKITITKKVNGHQKLKNKNELINEILNKLSSL